jgi:hypothetical protein
MTESTTAPARRAAYLAAAIELRQMAYRTHSPEMQRELMRLVVLYEQLAEYSASRPHPETTDEPRS